jgi:tetratricopeptide (TPR) repeat protein
LEKAIEIKRRAQRFIQNGDLDAALKEYEKLVASEDTDPYNFVLLADLMFKRGDTPNAVQRYLAAISAYEKNGLYKNAIAVCKKMMRLSLSPAHVFDRLAHLHALDGLSTEAALYYMQYAEHLVREEKPRDAAAVLRKAFEVSHEEIRALERMAEVFLLAGDMPEAGRAMAEAAHYYEKAGQAEMAERCRNRAQQLSPGARFDADSSHALTSDALEPGRVALPGANEIPLGDPAPPVESEPAAFEAPSMIAPPPIEAEPPAAPPVAPPRLQTMDLEPTVIPSRPTVSSPPPPAAEMAETEGPAMDPAERGLQFESPAVARDSDPDASDPLAGRLAEIEALLAEAQECFRAGDRARAEGLLMEAARRYESVGRLENAAAIYRSLVRSSQADTELWSRWLANCEQRDDRREAAGVACELGDRCLQENDVEGAREWFERAHAHDPNNALAKRRLDRLAESLTQGAPVPAPASTVNGPGPVPVAVGEEPADPRPGTPGEEQGRVEMAVGRGEAVTFDLGSLLSEFQRGIAAQISGDAQSHYDLAMAYREMELLDQAVESFRVAARDPAILHRAAEMIGRCLLDQGRAEDAVRELREALSSAAVDSEAAIGLRYQLAIALEAAGRTADALVEYENVYSMRPNHADITYRLSALRNATGMG